MATTWFTWNETDLTQFDTAIVGSGVTSHMLSVVTLAGKQWIRLEVNPVGGVVTIKDGLVVLPISATPPSGDYEVEADCVRLEGSTRLGHVVLTRFVNVSQAYWLELNYSTSYAYQIRKLDGTAAGQVRLSITNPKRSTSNPFGLVPATNYGQHLKLSVHGSSVVEMETLGKNIAADIISPYTTVGKAAIGASCADGDLSTTGQQIICLFRNIKCKTYE